MTQSPASVSTATFRAVHRGLSSGGERGGDERHQRRAGFNSRTNEVLPKFLRNAVGQRRGCGEAGPDARDIRDLNRETGG